MAKAVFQCELQQSILKRKGRLEKGMYLEISDGGITGRGIVYSESAGNEFPDDIKYDFKSITSIEIADYRGMLSLKIHISSASLYGTEKIQVILPGLREVQEAAELLYKYVDESKGKDSRSNKSMYIPEPIQKAEYKEEAESEIEVIELEKKEAPAPAPAAAPVASAPAPAPAPVQAEAPKPEVAPVISMEEYQRKLAKLETIYLTGMLTEKEYKTRKAEYISNLNGLDDFFKKVEVNLQYSEIGFLSEKEFADFQKEMVDDCSKLTGVTNEVFRQNLKKLFVLYLTEILTADEYEVICDDIIESVEYVTSDPEAVIIEKIEKWPILKECEIISESQYEQFLKLITEDTKLKPGDSVEVLEHKLVRMLTLSKTFIYVDDEFERHKNDIVTEMTNFDLSNESRLKDQIEKMMVLKKCEWLSEAEYTKKKADVLTTIEGNQDSVARMQLLGLFAEINFISAEDYNGYKSKLIDEIFANLGNIGELKEKAMRLMNLKNAGIITEKEFDDYKKKLMSF